MLGHDGLFPHNNRVREATPRKHNSDGILRPGQVLNYSSSVDCCDRWWTDRWWTLSARDRLWCCETSAIAYNRRHAHVRDVLSGGCVEAPTRQLQSILCTAVNKCSTPIAYNPKNLRIYTFSRCAEGCPQTRWTTENRAQSPETQKNVEHGRPGKGTQSGRPLKLCWLASGRILCGVNRS